MLTVFSFYMFKSYFIDANYFLSKWDVYLLVLLFPPYKWRAFKHTTMKQWNTQYLQQTCTNKDWESVM